MKKFVILTIAIALFAFSDFKNQITPQPAPSSEHPVMHLPKQLSQRNWIGRGGGGSCVVASMVDLLNWQGKPATARRLKAKYSGGQDYDGWRAALDAEGIRYASTRAQFDVGFLERAIATRRGCMVTVMGEAHMVCLVDLTSTKAAILDNNFPNEIFWYDRNEFLAEWKNANSWALTPVYSPTSPRVP